MGLRIATNVQSLAGQRSLSQVKREQSDSLEKLASGSRINRAGDDAAGLAISEKLKSNIRGVNQAARNAGDGVSLIQTAEGAMNEVNNILIRLRELSVQASSDTIGDKERAYSDMEFQQLVTEVERIATSTTFNEKQLLSGEGDEMEFQIGIHNVEKNDRIKYRPQDTSVKVEELGIEGLNVASKGDSQENLETLDGAINKVNTSRAQLGALQNRLQSTIRNLEVKSENLSGANSRIRDTDIAEETAKLAKANILAASSTSVLAQSNNSSSGALQLIG
ncbi:MAG: flagellin [Halobacteriovoraceae bacterium]|jgi:flagellin|nr:flagellin [Halobacteriovoraceae bacterium]